MAKVLHVISGLGLGGAEMALARLAVGLQKRGHPQQVVTLTGHGIVRNLLELHSIPVTELKVGSVAKSFAAIFRLAALIRSTAPDVVQGWMYHGNLVATLAHVLAWSGLRPRLFWNIRASNMDACRYGQLIKWSARLSRLPDLIIANSNAGAQFHLQQGFQPWRLEVLPNGIDTEKFRPDASLRQAFRLAQGIPPEAVLVIHVARVDPMKDHATFLAAMNKLPEVRAVLVGMGTQNLSLPPNVSALGLRTDVERLYPAADIVVSTSAFGEGFSNVLAEGMSAGLVPIATDVGDAKLIVGDTGIIVPPRDETALAAAITRTVTLEPATRRRMGLAAREHIVTHFSLSRTVEAYERFYVS
jgi:glycosyltransferase involved in cell wall biosynthesis